MDTSVIAVTDSEESIAGTSGCPECREALPPRGELLVTQIVECDNCGAELEVVGLNPLLLALAPEVEEDWGE